VIGGRDDGEGHRDRHRYRERAKRDAGRHLEQQDADEEVPAGVKARQSCVLIRESRRLQSPVAVRVLRHGVDYRGIHEPRWCHGERREEGEADQAGDEHRVSQQPVLPSMPDVEEHPAAENDGPVSIHVDPVRRSNEEPLVQDELLEPPLPGDPERPLESQKPVGVLESTVDSALGQPSYSEVDEGSDGDDGNFPRDGKRVRRSNPLQASAHPPERW
jgi:hypothetical protein